MLMLRPQTVASYRCADVADCRTSMGASLSLMAGGESPHHYEVGVGSSHVVVLANTIAHGFFVHESDCFFCGHVLADDVLEVFVCNLGNGHAVKHIVHIPFTLTARGSSSAFHFDGSARASVDFDRSALEHMTNDVLVVSDNFVFLVLPNEVVKSLVGDEVKVVSVMVLCLGHGQW